MEYITIAVIIALVLPTAHAIWTAYDADRREIENRLLTRRNKDKTTLREQLDARRHMEALRAYQSEVRTHDKLAGGAPKQGT